MPDVDLLHGDPLAAWLRRRGQLTPRRTGLAALGLAVLFLLLAAAFGVLLERPGVTPALADPAYLGVLLLVTPAVWAYYAWQVGALEQTYRDLVACAQDPAAMTTALRDTRPQLSARLGPPLAAEAATIISLANLLVNQARFGLTWLSYNWVLMAAQQLLWWPTFYMVVMVGLRQLHAGRALSRVLARVPLQIVPRHPDGAGGLSRLGRYVYAAAYEAAVAGLFLGFMLLRTGPAVIVPGTLLYPLVLLYLGLAALLVAWPLLAAHRQMVAVKQRLLGDIAALFEAEYGQLLDDLRHATLLAQAAHRLRAYRKLYRLRAGLAEWPLNLWFVSRLVITISLPVVVPLGLNVLLSGLVR
ncbi:MAG: hypothetical protein IT317_04615 [Anaerolineales bacterium]|nr:hypothetical protein [Anaerolineales bacterium]